MPDEEPRPFFGTKLERGTGFSELLGKLLLNHSQKSGGVEFENPALKAGAPGQVLGQHAHFVC